MPPLAAPFRRRETQGGYVLPATALLIVVFLAFTALAVDVGVLLGARASAQRAADAGALAGASRTSTTN